MKFTVAQTIIKICQSEVGRNLFEAVGGPSAILIATGITLYAVFHFVESTVQHHSASKLSRVFPHERALPLIRVAVERGNLDDIDVLNVVSIIRDMDRLSESQRKALIQRLCQYAKEQRRELLASQRCFNLDESVV